MQSNNIAGNRGNSVISWKVPRNELSIDHQRNSPLIEVTAGRVEFVVIVIVISVAMQVIGVIVVAETMQAIEGS